MKTVKPKSLTKQIICIIIVLMLCNFIIPNYTYAVEVDFGDVISTTAGALFDAITGVLCFIPDTVLGYLQNMFVTLDTIKNEETGEFSIKYAPGTIFAGKIPMFDINFINPNTDVEEDTEYSDYVMSRAYLAYYPINEDGGNFNIAKNSGRYTYVSGREIQTKGQQGETVWVEAYYLVDGDNILIEYHFIPQFSWPEKNYYGSRVENISNIDTTEYKQQEYKSIASVLQGVVATWYNVFRRVTLVALLSILVYIGIRIVLTGTSAGDKAKYKKMLKDWLVALCILFTLHYIMSLTITIVDNINEILGVSVVGEDGEDILMTAVRNRVEEEADWKLAIVYVVIYFVLFIYTITFTIQYLKRVAYMAFFTAIAPLITLTYPLDKIKDSKAQAFEMWIKDYVFFALLQVVHLLIYYILLSSALDLTKEGHWMFAIVAIGFLTKAEKIIKKMFGFEKSNTMGALAAGATGALITNAFKKIPRNIPKLGEKEGKAQKEDNKIRTANPTKDPLEALRTNRQATLAQVATGAQSGIGTNNGVHSNSNNPNINEKEDKRTITGKGTSALFKKYWRPALMGAMKGAAGLTLGGTGAIIGAAAGISQGSLGGALTGAVAGASAGNNLGRGIPTAVGNTINGVKNTINDIGDTYNEGAYGEGYANTMRFKRTQDYKDLQSQFGNLTDDNLQAMIESGITDKQDMQKILKNGGDNINEAIGYYTLAKKCPDGIYYDDNKLEEYLKDLGVREQDAKTMREKMKLYRG